MKRERIILWIAVVLILGGTVFALAKLPKKETGTSNQVVELSAVSSADWVMGNKEAAVTLIEYGDFQCPACAAYHPLVKKMLEENGQNFKFVYRHFPLKQHAQAKDASYAAEAAGRQGKFWEMYDLVYTRQNDWAGKVNAKDIFLGYANSLGLNAEQFNKDRASSEVKDRVEKDTQDGLRAGLNSTPSFFVNGKKIQPRDYDEFLNFIKQAGVSLSPVASPSATP
ncbi:MAG: protein-disulfide isomerase [Parcubacteria group bacterium Gr01-1014_44]|nr:MAG: protein-disulfide isomerase [Parcubacteria group bacterium Gr01-1014_44]